MPERNVPANENHGGGTHPAPANENDAVFAEDLLRGANEIADFLFGSPSRRRRVYHLAATSNMPVFKLGSMLCARRSVLVDWIASQESDRA